MRTAPIAPKLFAACLLLLSAGSLLAQPDPHTLAKQAGFIFSGEVVAQGGKQIRLPLPARGLVVRVVDVLYVKPSISVRPGDLVVIQMAGETLPGAGTKAVFYTNGYAYGKYLTVRELGRLTQAPPTEELKQEIAQAKVEAEDDRLRDRLAGAELVIAGKVKAIRPYEEARRVSPVSEHDADWWLAEVEVTQFLKGESSKKAVLVAYPNSRDVMWADSPKFKAGQEGIWILSRSKNLIRIFALVQEPVYSAINARDFHEPKEAERLIRLLKAPPPNR